jgi:transcriptional regulator with XRE-family HTH domain
MADVRSLGARLRERREELGISQAQAARELDVARTAYRLWEMEAARPAPDRWRLISRWLGVSVVTMLLADELVAEEEAREGDVIRGRFGATGWDEEGALEPGEFFEQERALIERTRGEGRVTGLEAERLQELLERVRSRTAERVGSRWRAADFRRELPVDRTAPALARAAVLAASAGVPEELVLDAEVMTSDLVTNSVRFGPLDGDAVTLRIALDGRVLRVEVGEKASRRSTTDPSLGRQLDLVVAMASRWGGERSNGIQRTWFELDLPE